MGGSSLITSLGGNSAISCKMIGDFGGITGGDVALGKSTFSSISTRSVEAGRRGGTSTAVGRG